MKLKLTKNQIMKIICSLRLCEIEERLDYNYKVWTWIDDGIDFELEKFVDKEKELEEKK